MKSSKKTMSIMSLKADYGLNVREVNNYDLPAMEADIIRLGRIVTPLIVEKVGDDYIVLQGNRRCRAGQRLHQDGSISSDLKAALGKVDVVVYEDITAKERVELINDHGGVKPLSRWEIVNSIWRASKQMLSEKEIIIMMYFQLADYTGNRKKLAGVPRDEVDANGNVVKKVDPAEREKYLSTWLHTTVGQKILQAASLGDYVARQFELTSKSEDKLLTEAERLEFQVNIDMDRIKALTKAKKADQETTGWSVSGGGASFNALLEEYKAVDAGAKEETTAPKRLSVTEVEKKAELFKSSVVSDTLKATIGDEEAKRKLLAHDETAYRHQLVTEVLSKHVGNIKDDNVRMLIMSILSGPAGGVEKTIEKFI